MAEKIEFCGICYHNLKGMCQIRKSEVEHMSYCSQFRLQTHCVICKMAIQEEGVFSHPEGGRICQDCHDYMGEDSY